MVNFTPFRLIFKMRSPVVLAQHPPHLDALLAFALNAHLGEQVGVNPGPALDRYLDKDPVTGVYRASALSFGVTPEQGLSAASVTRVGRLRDEQRVSHWFKPNGRNGRYSKLVVLGGPTKARFNTKQAYAAPYVVFDGVGHKEPIKRLLEFYLGGVGHEGFNAGFGCFEAIRAVDLEQDSSWFRDGRQVRNLPAELVPASSRNSIKARAVPPYWQQGNEIDIIPCERVSILPIMESF